MKDLEQIGRELQNALTVIDRSQRWLAQKAQVPQSTISRLINGKIENPDSHIIARLAEALGVDSMRWLRLAGLIVEIPRTERPPDVEIVADRLAELDPDLRGPAVEAVAGVVDAFYAIRNKPRRPDGESVAQEIDEIDKSIDQADAK